MSHRADRPVRQLMRYANAARKISGTSSSEGNTLQWRQWDFVGFFSHPRHLANSPDAVSMLFSVSRPAFIDIETLKMNFPLAPSEERGGLTFRPDFKWVVAFGQDGISLARIVVR